MPGDTFEHGGLRRGIPLLFDASKSFLADSVHSLTRLGNAIERRGSTLPLLRRLSVRVRAPSLPNEYEAIPLHRPGTGSPHPSRTISPV